MTHHFVNIVSWRIFAEHNFVNSKINIDGYLLKFVLRCYGVKINKQSGLNYFHNHINSDMCFLLPSFNSNFKHNYILPFWSETESVQLTEDLENFIVDFKDIIIGISSPKQDVLADHIMLKYPHINVYCLGAAVSASRIINSEILLVTWFTMFFNSPVRTLQKLKLSLKELLLIFFEKESRILFREFIMKNQL